MADTQYSLPDGGIVLDREDGDYLSLPDIGIYKTRDEPVVGGLTIPIARRRDR